MNILLQEIPTAINWNVIIPSIIAFLGTCFSGYLAYKMAQIRTDTHATAENTVGAKESADSAAKKVDNVERALAKSTTKADEQRDRIESTGKKTHTLVNSNMSEQLKISALALRRVADLTGDKNDALVAEAAESAWSGHDQKQGLVDASEKGT